MLEQQKRVQKKRRSLEKAVEGEQLRLNEIRNNQQKKWDAGPRSRKKVQTEVDRRKARADSMRK